jgi:4-diphosphocytidyl-2-C-methyl-D-erythritol kinase
MTVLRDCPAPAKLNLFLHVTGRRADGYHLLETAFQLIDLADTLHLERRADGQILRPDPLPEVAPEDDLVTRAARLLQRETGTHWGASIRLEKRIPMGGGLGGGSSDAATTLYALNRLWELGLDRAQLMRLGVRLGADVPFFLFGQNALARGIGEELEALATPVRHFAVIYPGVAVPTAAVFGAPELTRNTVPIKIADFCADASNPGSGTTLGVGRGVLAQGFGHNDLEPVAVARYPAVGAALQWLARFGAPRMSGSGACVFCAFESEDAARRALAGLPERWSGWVCAGLSHHPLASWTRA